MVRTGLHSISKLFLYVFLVYIMLYYYIFGERRVILYGSIGVAAGLMIVDMVLSRENINNIFPKSVLVNLIMCLYSLMIGLFVARDQNVLIGAVKTYVSFSMVCIVICYISKGEKEIDWLLNALIVICIVESVLVLTRGFYVYNYGYVLGPRHNPNTLGMNMDIGIFCLAYKSKRKTNYNLGYLIIAVLFLYMIIGCGSRKCLIAGGIMCTLWFLPLFQQLWNRGNTVSRIFYVFAVVAIVFGVYYFMNNIYINSESFNRMQTLEKESIDGKRVRYYKQAIGHFLEHPIFGIGLQQFRVWNTEHAYSHSTYAEALSSWGIVGCIIYFVPLISVGLAAIKESLTQHDPYIPRIVFGLWIMELFLGVGQIWFYDIEHFIAWTIISLCIEEKKTTEQYVRSTCKYVKV